ncbi:MAG: hypothetical protein PVI03_03975 [Candidatus Thorarchaeota archaeon]|jgi:hypothetical protein
MKTRQEYIVSVEHSTTGTMMYTVRGVSRKQALQHAILKYPNAMMINVLGGE